MGNNKLNIMICVTRQKTCERLIKVGRDIAGDGDARLYAVHVAKKGVNFLGNPDEGEALDYLFQVSKEAGAEMTVLRSEHVVDTLVEFARKSNISIIVLGESAQNTNREESIIDELKRNLPDLEFRIVPQA
ncbi:MAG: universal stress protein [Clostridiales bacterium]|jgi:K+-sensing histidine kinase KdpD|nr:universal stress protein [Clostridiales bacterium]